ncbi:PIN domain nuclease, a component of toxin-antitoxin system (PIN domain) [Sphingomonas gellani]|uniref:PIN domain nuclease, a component of toxin-antitoxin system (PIN domain) n=1 Tax=Sphingomonas gellani TaxID=1166340 RepID=A0A1H8I9S1_9SPHN|nr:type II toxin-antitoxin system VapC family toxin [Sphingomonas gellani]SEN64776.1 PIN domain nuclease, a component of toxin-antitoxin system (PIN domain) [Sphingomonas gellani]
MYVLDASALLCLLFDEPGADHVGDRLAGALVSATNYSEVIAKLVDRGAPVEEIVGIMADLEVEIVAVDRHQAERAGLLRETTRNAGLSLGDRACLALAQTRRAVALTTDRAWAELDLGLEVELAR